MANFSGSFADDPNPMSGNIQTVPHIGIQGPRGPQGPEGGHYVPNVKQTGENELLFEFTPSKPDMPAVDPVQVSLPAAPDSGGNVAYDEVQNLTEEQKAQARDNIGAQPVGNYLTEHQDISGKLDASELPTAIDTALAQAKASGEFDGDKGEQGIQGEPGADGKNGEDGKTPVKGVDYWTSEDKAEIVEDVLAEMPDVPGSGSALPPVTAENNGAFLRVVNGAWAVATIPSAEGVSF